MLRLRRADELGQHLFPRLRLSLRNGGFATGSAAEMGWKPDGDSSKKAAPDPSALRGGIGRTSRSFKPCGEIGQYHRSSFRLDLELRYEQERIRFDQEDADLNASETDRRKVRGRPPAAGDRRPAPAHRKKLLGYMPSSESGEKPPQFCLSAHSPLAARTWNRHTSCHSQPDAFPLSIAVE